MQIKKSTLESGLKRCGFSERIHWFRVDGRPIRIKKICGFKNIRIRVDGALVCKGENKLFIEHQPSLEFVINILYTSALLISVEWTT